MPALIRKKNRKSLLLKNARLRNEVLYNYFQKWLLNSAVLSFIREMFLAIVELGTAGLVEFSPEQSSLQQDSNINIEYLGGTAQANPQYRW